MCRKRLKNHPDSRSYRSDSLYLSCVAQQLPIKALSRGICFAEGANTVDIIVFGRVSLRCAASAAGLGGSAGSILPFVTQGLRASLLLEAHRADSAGSAGGVAPHMAANTGIFRQRIGLNGGSFGGFSCALCGICGSAGGFCAAGSSACTCGIGGSRIILAARA